MELTEFIEQLPDLRQRAFRMGMRVFGSVDVAENVAQEALLHAWVGFPGFQEDSSIATWFYKVTRNAIFDRLRKRSYVECVGSSIDLELLSEEERLSSELFDPHVDYVQQEARCLVDKILGRLEPRWRAIIELQHLEGYGQEEVTEELGISMATVKNAARVAHRLCDDSYARLLRSSIEG